MASAQKSWIVSLLFTLFGGPCIMLFFLPLALTHGRLAQQHSELRVLAFVMIALGLLPLFESIARFVRVGRGTLMPNVPTEELVVSGFYRHVRNPMYVGDLTVLLGETLLAARWQMLLYTALVWAALHLFILRYEEPTLTRRHGESYRRYRQHVRRWLPRVSAWKQ